MSELSQLQRIEKNRAARNHWHHDTATVTAAGSVRGRDDTFELTAEEIKKQFATFFFEPSIRI